MARVDGGGLWLHGEDADECGPGELERLGANREVSRVADEGAKLAKATNATDARLRPQNDSDPSVEFHRRAQSEREGEVARMRAQLNEGSE
jgi:hypothetical protein